MLAGHFSSKPAAVCNIFPAERLYKLLIMNYSLLYDPNKNKNTFWKKICLTLESIYYMYVWPFWRIFAEKLNYFSLEIELLEIENFENQ